MTDEPLVIVERDGERRIALVRFNRPQQLNALNGEVIHSKNVVRSANCNDDNVKTALKTGDNTLMIKVTQGGADWSFCCRIASAEGGPPDNLNFKAK